ncbi:MAG: hypothetical protein WBP43_02710 [Chitinophagales bacterium]|nr:hypothetical protein [Bacteroidota bacterium]
MQSGKYLCFFVLILFVKQFTFAQQIYTATIFNSETGKPFANCPVKVNNYNSINSTDSLGKLEVNLPDTGKISLTVYALNCHTEVEIKKPGYQFEPILIFCPTYELAPVDITYMDANTIIKKAAAKIPTLYADSAYVAFGFYRNYKKINGVFKEFTEGDIATVMRINKNEHDQLINEEAFGIQTMRRTRYTIPIDDFYDRALMDLFRQNLIYHTAFAVFNPYFFRHAEFEIDSASTDSTWIINYRLRGIIGENHGIDNYDPDAFFGEGKETGYYVINKSDYAILKIVRETIRDKRYQYPKYNNFLMPDLEYTGEFDEGFLEINFVLFEGKYYLKNIYHAHTNSFTHVATNQLLYKVTDYSEYTCDSIGYVITPTIQQTLETYANNELVKYNYNENDWLTTPPFYFINPDIVFSDIRKRGQLYDLFVAGGK